MRQTKKRWGSHLRRAGGAMSNLRTALLNRCSTAVHAVLAASCVLCGGRTTRLQLCSECRDDLPALPQARCVRCALPLPSGSVCASCLDPIPSYDAVVAAYPYEFPI